MIIIDFIVASAVIVSRKKVKFRDVSSMGKLVKGVSKGRVIY